MSSGTIDIHAHCDDTMYSINQRINTKPLSTNQTININNNNNNSNNSNKFSYPLLPGSIMEIFGESSCGKSESLYQAALNAILPKQINYTYFTNLPNNSDNNDKVNNSTSVTILLNGLNQICIYLDLDYRFNIERFKQLFNFRLKFALDEFNATAHISSTIDIQLFFQSDDYKQLCNSILSNLILIQAETPLEALIALKQIEKYCIHINNYDQNFKGNNYKYTHEQLQQARIITKNYINTGFSGINSAERPAIMFGFNSIDSTKPNSEPPKLQILNNSLSPIIQNDVLSITSILSPRLNIENEDKNKSSFSIDANVIRVGSLLIDNIAAFYWIDKSQQENTTKAKQSIKIMHKYKEEREIENSEYCDNSLVGLNIIDNSKFYDCQFIPVLSRILLSQRLSCIVTKPLFFNKQLNELYSEFRIGIETLGSQYQRLIGHRILCRKATQNIQYNINKRMPNDNTIFHTIYEARFMSTTTNTPINNNNPFVVSNSNTNSSPLKFQYSYYYSIKENGIQQHE